MITFRKLSDTIVGTINGKPFNIPKSDEMINLLTEVQKDPSDENIATLWNTIEGARHTIIAGSNKYLIYSPASKKYYLTLDGKVSKYPIPDSLVEFIEESYDKDIDFMPVIKAWEAKNIIVMKRGCNTDMIEYFEAYLNTEYLDKEEYNRLITEKELEEGYARGLATYQDIAITQEGLLATYKVAEQVTWAYEMVEQEDGTFEKVQKDRYKKIPSKVDDVTGDVLTEESFVKPESKEEFVFTPAIYTHGDKFFSGNKLGYIYEVGKMQYLPKDAKRNLNNTFGGGGLYIGGLRYVEGYRNHGTHVLTCFVNPRDIISFQSEGHAIRVDALMPYNIWDEDAPLKGKYHSSEYGKTSEERIDAIVTEAIEQGYDLVEYQMSLEDE